MKPNAQGLKKKLGPLPMWAWILVAGGTIGLLWMLSSKKKTAASATQQTQQANQVDPNNPMGLTYAQEQQDAAQGVDPLTGVPYSQEQQSILPAGTGTGPMNQTPPGKTIFQEIQDLRLAEKALAELRKNNGHHPPPMRRVKRHDRTAHHHHKQKPPPKKRQH